jgi:hypothetical protein
VLRRLLLAVLLQFAILVLEFRKLGLQIFVLAL